MTSEMLLTNDQPLRFKIIRPVYETLTVNDQNAQYQDAHLSSSREVVKLFDFLSRETKEHFMAVHLGQTGDGLDCRKCHDPHVAEGDGLLQAQRHDPFAAGACDACHPASAGTPGGNR